MQLILFRGRPGTGKTTMSNLLSRKINIPVLRKDDIYDSIISLSNSHDQRNQITFNILYTILQSNMHSRCNLILDCPFQFDEDIKLLRAWSKNHQVHLKTILVVCSDESMWAERFKERAKNPAPNQLITDFDGFKARYNKMQLKPDEGELLIDTINPPDQNLMAIVDFVNPTFFNSKP